MNGDNCIIIAILCGISMFFALIANFINHISDDSFYQNMPYDLKPKIYYCWQKKGRIGMIVDDFLSIEENQEKVAVVKKLITNFWNTDGS